MAMGSIAQASASLAHSAPSLSPPTSSAYMQGSHVSMKSYTQKHAVCSACCQPCRAPVCTAHSPRSHLQIKCALCHKIIRTFAGVTRTLQTTMHTMKTSHGICTSHAVRIACHAAERCWIIRQLIHHDTEGCYCLLLSAG